jgi:plastocyanin
MRLILALVISGLFGPTALALAENYTVHQKGRMFSSEITSVRKGQAVTFLNDDTVPHNVFSTSDGNKFDLGSQSPGASTDVTFTKAGEVEVICAIHPRMKLNILVTD